MVANESNSRYIVMYILLSCIRVFYVHKFVFCLIYLNRIGLRNLWMENIIKTKVLWCKVVLWYICQHHKLHERNRKYYISSKHHVNFCHFVAISLVERSAMIPEPDLRLLHIYIYIYIYTSGRNCGRRKALGIIAQVGWRKWKRQLISEYPPPSWKILSSWKERKL